MFHRVPQFDNSTISACQAHQEGAGAAAALKGGGAGIEDWESTLRNHRESWGITSRNVLKSEANVA